MDGRLPRGQFSLQSLFVATFLVALFCVAARVLYLFPGVIVFGAIPAAFVATLFIPWFLSGRIENPVLFLLATVGLSLCVYLAAFGLMVALEGRRWIV